jgi:diaminopimelate decarboxylase
MLTIGGERPDELAASFGTPLIVIDLRELDGAISAVRAACDPHGVKISYAGKALLVTALARRIDAAGLGIDVCSLGELVTAERAGITPSRLTLHGAGKLDDELCAALDGRVGRIVVDGLDELRRLCAMSSERKLDVLLRLNTGIEAHTHEFVRTAGDGSKFGFAPHEEAVTLDLLRAAPHLQLRGVHSHIGSQIYDAEPFAANAEYLASAIERCRAAGFEPDTMVCGGGFGVPEFDTAAAIEAMIPHALRVNATLEIEPGRALIAQAGTSIYRVLARKRYDARTFLIVDGSLGDNPRPALYGAHHDIVETESSDAPRVEMTICGRSCENDFLAVAHLPDDIGAGALLAVHTTGAYTYSMASNYNRFTRPALVGVGDGTPFELARRETIEDVLRNDS